MSAGLRLDRFPVYFQTTQVQTARPSSGSDTSAGSYVQSQMQKMSSSESRSLSTSPMPHASMRSREATSKDSEIDGVFQGRVSKRFREEDNPAGSDPSAGRAKLSRKDKPSNSKEDATLKLKELTDTIQAAPLEYVRGCWGEVCQEHLDEMNHIHLTSALHSFARKWAKLLTRKDKDRVYEENKGTINDIKGKILGKVEDLDAQGLANVVWSLAKLGIKDGPFVAKISDRAQGKIKGFTQQYLNNIAWAFAEFGIDDRPLFAKISEQACKLAHGHSKKLQPQHFVKVVWSFAKLNIKNEPFFIEISKLAQRQIKNIHTDNLVKLASAIALFFPKDPCLPVIFNELDRRVKFLELEDLTRVYHAFYKCDRLRSLHRYPQLQISIKDGGVQDRHRNEDGTVSPVQQRICDAFKGLGFDPKMDQFELGYFLDIVLPRKMVVKVTGPAHYLASGNRAGDFQLEKDILEGDGWVVVEVPEEEWNKQTTEEAQKAYLKKAIGK